MAQQLLLFAQQLLWEQWPQQRFFEGCWNALTQVLPQELPLKAYQMAETERRRLAEWEAMTHMAKRMRTLSVEDTPSKRQRWVVSQWMLEAPCYSSKGPKRKRIYTPLEEEDLYYYDDDADLYEDE